MDMHRRGAEGGGGERGGGVGQKDQRGEKWIGVCGRRWRVLERVGVGDGGLGTRGERRRKGKAMEERREREREREGGRGVMGLEST
jgi:hypothetical protein